MPKQKVDQRLLITAEQIRGLVNSGATIHVVDVRGSASYRRSSARVEGDLRLMASEVTALEGKLGLDDWVLSYCTCLNDGLAVRASERLRDLGYHRARAIVDGLEGCRRGGLDVVTKPTGDVAWTS